MSDKRDLLIEVGTEELPPRALRRLAAAFRNELQTRLGDARLGYASAQLFASPRRLALLVRELDVQQPEAHVEKRGPALAAAYDEEGCATKAAQGFARSCGVAVEDLDKLENDKGAWLVYRHVQAGEATAALVPAMVQQALDALPIPKRMRWGALDCEFVRPVHWLVLLFGNEVIEAELFGVRAGRETRGHRFHHPQPIYLPAPDEYEMLLESEGKVIADFERRQRTVKAMVEQAAAQSGGHAVIDVELLAEVTAMVEWPVAVLGSFEERFLAVPAEALISTMKSNQKYFHLVDPDGQLLPHFITIANVESKSPDKVRAGNERVVRPRLADAEFFWNQDRKTTLAARVPALDGVVFQKQLGTLHDKSRRVAALAAHIAAQLEGNKQLAARAADLCKCDLMTDMVGEFPELQGIMGRYYAQHDGEPDEVAQAIEEHYLPRFAGDRLPESATGQALAVADRIDTLTGIFAIGKTPSGDRDPFALRRAALGVLRILIEKSLDLDLHALLEKAAGQFDKKVKAAAAVPAVFEYMMERLRAYYQDREIGMDVLEAVISRKPTRPLDIDQRIRAVDAFRRLPEAQSLAAANKRIGNILKQAEAPRADSVDTALLREPQESALYETLTRLSDKVTPLLENGKFDDALKGLAGLREPVDAFFDHVLVMDEDQALRNNRVAMLGQLHSLFLQVADVSKLQG